MRRLVILRPEPGASASLAKARLLGFDAVAVPLFDVQPLAWVAPDPEPWDGIVATSANAFRHGGAGLEMLTSLPVHAVGETTAEAARSSGFLVASVGDGGAEALAPRLPAGRLLHLCGEHFRAISGTTAIPVYRSVAIDPPPALDQLAGAVAAVHSPRAGARLAELVGERQSIVIAAISAAAAEATGPGWTDVAISDEPRDEALLALAGRLCQEDRK